MKLYNGIPLPALPEWDKTVYTHGFVQYGGVTGLEAYSLIVSTASGVMGDSYTVGEHTYSAWVVADNEQIAANLSGAYPGISTKEWLQFEDGKTVTTSTYDNIVWSDFDILKADGSVYLKASKPYDLESFKTGLALGLCGETLPWKAEPVAWLYNGVRLPKLPEWDKEKYPYAFIGIKDDVYYVVARAIAAPVYLRDGIPVVITAMSDPVYSLEDGNWVKGSGAYRSFNPVWTEYDIYYADADENGELAVTLYLAASEPVPVYE